MSHTVTAEAHTITTREDGPDLDDLVRLIRYLRTLGVYVSIGNQLSESNAVVVSWTRFPKPGQPNNAHPTTVVEGRLPKEAFYVGPQGEVYDANGEELNHGN